jgi:hypothetical protein
MQLYSGSVGVAPGTLTLGSADPWSLQVGDALAVLSSFAEDLRATESALYLEAANVPSITEGPGTDGQNKLLIPVARWNAFRSAWSVVKPTLAQAITPEMYSRIVDPAGQPAPTCAGTLEYALEVIGYVPTTLATWLLIAAGVVAAAGVVYAVVRSMRNES